MADGTCASPELFAERLVFPQSEIVRDHRGRIELDSAEGQGSTFRMRLPLAGA